MLLCNALMLCTGVMGLPFFFDMNCILTFAQCIVSVK